MVKNVLDREYKRHKSEYDAAALKVLESGWYITGTELESFEQRFANYIGSPFCVGVANGLDALWIGMKALGITEGDEVLVQSNSYIATVMGITINNATPVFVEPDECFNMDVTKIEEKITDKTKAILVTHLYGQVTNMTEVVKICKKHNLLLIEDCAQSHGSKHNGQVSGSFGDLACFSFYPTKNLGAFGDGGAITTPHKEVNDFIRVYRNYGSEKRYFNKMVGINSRLDELQAALLNVKLNYLDDLNRERQAIAELYDNEIKNPYISLPKKEINSENIYHQYVIQTDYRDELIEYLNENKIGSIIHYPVPPHLSEAYAYLNLKEGSFPIAEKYAHTVLSLPIFDGMTKDEAKEVIKVINQFKSL